MLSYGTRVRRYFPHNIIIITLLQHTIISRVGVRLLFSVRYNISVLLFFYLYHTNNNNNAAPIHNNVVLVYILQVIKYYTSLQRMIHQTRSTPFNPLIGHLSELRFLE